MEPVREYYLFALDRAFGVLVVRQQILREIVQLRTSLMFLRVSRAEQISIQIGIHVVACNMLGQHTAACKMASIPVG